MKHKLVLIFEDEVFDVDKMLIFDNELDAESYLLSKGLISVCFYTSSNYFTFNTTSWKGTGTIHWVKYI